MQILYLPHRTCKVHLKFWSRITERIPIRIPDLTDSLKPLLLLASAKSFESLPLCKSYFLYNNKHANDKFERFFVKRTL